MTIHLSRSGTLLFTTLFILFATAIAQSPADSKDPQTGPAVIGYYAGRSTALDSFATEKLTHILYSFCHLQGNRLFVNNARDTATIHHMVELKTRNPRLKVILSLGGWGGCKTCPLV